MFFVALAAIAFALWNPWIASIEIRVFLAVIVALGYLRRLTRGAFVFTHERIDDIEEHVGMPEVIDTVDREGNEERLVIAREGKMRGRKRR